jgi:hypothetical protein
VAHHRHARLHYGARRLHARGAAPLQLDRVHAALLEHAHSGLRQAARRGEQRGRGAGSGAAWACRCLLRVHVYRGAGWRDARGPGASASTRAPAPEQRPTCTASLVDVSYDPKGRSPTRNARLAPLAAALQWPSMSSSVMGSVVSWPCTTMATLSPTSRMSIWAWSTCAQGGWPGEEGRGWAERRDSGRGWLAGREWCRWAGQRARWQQAARHAAR